jgi:predicted ferric reductase
MRSPVVRARLLLWGVVAVNVLVVEALLVTAGAGRNQPLTIAKFLGLHAALLMMLQLALAARIPWLDRRLGMDRLLAWHRVVGLLLLWTVVGHATFILLGFMRLGDAPPATAAVTLASAPSSLMGILAATVVVVAATLSLRAARRRLRYETWHAVHLTLYAAVSFGILHQLLTANTTFTSSPAARAYWWSMWSLAIAAIIGGRFVLPLWRNARHRLRVSAVVPESGDVVSVHVTGNDLDRLPARAGQFLIWRFPGHFGWWQANPFSLSAAPDGKSLRLTAKAVGATSAGLRDLPVGTRVFFEGPYGAFTSLCRTSPGMLLIAGGIGVTPIRALLQESGTGAVVVYRVRTEQDAVLAGELRALAEVRDAQVHLLIGRTGTSPVFSGANLLGLVPDIAERDVYVCGPPGMVDAVLAGLRELRVPARQVHTERFSLA